MNKQSIKRVLLETHFQPVKVIADVLSSNFKVKEYTIAGDKVKGHTHFVGDKVDCFRHLEKMEKNNPNILLVN